jgi:GNAT superfamily N-acetyltransferase
MTTLRVADTTDIPRLESLIEQSVRGLSPGFYTPMQIESALRHLFGVDSQLIADGTYFVIESGDRLAAAGGWSRRRTLYGGDRAKGGADPLLDAAREAARIRAFFVRPEWARKGLARRLFDACEAAARPAGFQRFELMATLPGVPLYAALGFASHERVDVALPDGVLLSCIRMTRPIAVQPTGGARAAGPTRAREG